MINVEHLNVRFGKKTVLKELNVQFKEREFVTIAGSNGAGKSTFLRTLMGIVSPAKGKVSYNNGLKKEKIGFLSDRSSFLENYSVDKGIDFHCNVYQLKEFDDSLIRQMGLNGKEKVKDLSFGQRVLYLFSLIMAQGPRVLLLDEVLHAVDPYLRELFVEQLLDMVDRCDTLVVAVNHTFSEIETIPGRILVMEDGRFILDEDAEELKTKIKKVELEPGEKIPDSVPVLFRKETDYNKEYYVYPFSEELKETFDTRYQDMKLNEIVKSFIGGYYVKKRVC